MKAGIHQARVQERGNLDGGINRGPLSQTYLEVSPCPGGVVATVPLQQANEEVRSNNYG